VAKVINEEKVQMMTNTKKGGTEFGTLTLTNNQIENTIDISDALFSDDDITIDIDCIDLSAGDASIDATIDWPFDIFDVGTPLRKFTFPSDLLAIICELKNKQIGNVEIVQILEGFLLSGTLDIGDSELEKHFHNPSNAAKEKADDIRKHFESKFTVAALKSGDVSDTRKKMMRLLREDLSAKTVNSACFPLLVTIPDFYDEDLKLEHLQSHYRSEKSAYKNDMVPIAKTLYPVLKTSRGKSGGNGSSHSGASYFWVDEEKYVYRIWCERSNRLRPFLDYFFSKESVDFVIHKMSRDKIPSVDLFFYDVRQIQPAETIYI